jgi:uncharacterized protein
VGCPEKFALDLPFISDPFFYVVSVHAVLLLGISKSGFGAGLGSLAVPVMALSVKVSQAAAIWMPVLFVMGVLVMAAFRKDMDKRLLFPPYADSTPPPRWLGTLLLTTSGFRSFIAHADGPPVNAYVIPLKLKPVVFTGTMAVLFFYVNLAKWMPYAWLGLLDLRNFATSLLLLPLALLGVWMGVHIARRIESFLFYWMVFTDLMVNRDLQF